MLQEVLPGARCALLSTDSPTLAFHGLLLTWYLLLFSTAGPSVFTRGSRGGAGASTVTSGFHQQHLPEPPTSILSPLNTSSTLSLL